MLPALMTAHEHEGTVLALGFAVIIALDAVFQGRHDRSEKMQLALLCGISIIALLCEAPLLVLGALVFSVLQLGLGGKGLHWSLRCLYLLPNLGVLAWGSYLLYGDMGGLHWNAASTVRSETILVFCLAALLRGGMVPFHGLLLRRLEGHNGALIMHLVNPVGFFMPVLLINHSHVLPALPGSVDGFLALGFLVSAYFSLASFSERSFWHFLFYVFTGLTSLTLAMVPLLGAEFTIAVVYFYGSTMVATTGLLLCLRFLHRRYGCDRLRGRLGMYQASPLVSGIFIFFLFCLGSMPLTLSYVGEDVMLNLIFHESRIAGIFALGIFSLNGISLFRFYTLAFGGVWPNYPQLPLLRHERWALSLLVSVGLVLPLLSFC